MLIVLSLCESKPSHRPAQCHVGTQWCIYSVQIHGRALTCFIVLYVDLHQPCRGAAGRVGKTSRNRTAVSLLTDLSLCAAVCPSMQFRVHISLSVRAEDTCVNQRMLAPVCTSGASGDCSPKHIDPIRSSGMLLRCWKLLFLSCLLPAVNDRVGSDPQLIWSFQLFHTIFLSRLPSWHEYSNFHHFMFASQLKVDFLQSNYNFMAAE